MANSNGYHVAGATLQRSTDGVSYTTVENVQGLTLTGGNKDTVESTAIDATAKTYADGLPNFGTVQVRLADDPTKTTHQNLFTDYTSSNTSRYWKVGHPASGTVGDLTFAGPVTGWEVDMSQNGLIVTTVTIQVSGSVARATS